MKKKIIAGILALLALATSFFLVFSPIYQVTFLSEPYYVQLPELKGRIFSGEKINPGTFTIQEDFGSVSQWGPESILSYAVIPREGIRNSGSKVKISVWKPDPKTTGVFQYAEKIIERPEEWSMFHDIGEVDRENNYLKIHPTGSDFFGFVSCFGIMIVVFLSALSIALLKN